MECSSAFTESKAVLSCLLSSGHLFQHGRGREQASQDADYWLVQMMLVCPNARYLERKIV